jgi:hypothetical protein
MAHFAKLDENNSVIQVIVVNNDVLLDANGNESEQLGQEFCTQLLGGNWVQTSYNANFRKNYAGTGHTYDLELDAFIPPSPFPSWVLDTATCQWAAPLPYPDDGESYSWDEGTQSWILLTLS